ncbi:MAG: competence/damage-inducible protein A [Bacteroidetes bacterium]|nr:competence/damage-inducible protein A [Bacteroidota bacterium]
MKAELISIGDELLIGQVVNTNASWMAEQLNLIGIDIVQITSIADKKQDIKASLDRAFQHSDLVMITGGLGPTNDDITKLTLCEYFNAKLQFNQDAYFFIEKLFAQRGWKTVTELNRQQAEVPDNCKIIPNHNGTAPGMWFEDKGKILISLPGVPFEMKAMVSNYIIPQLKEKSVIHIFHKTLHIQGVGESFLAELIKDWENQLPVQIKLAYLPQPGLIRLRLTAKGKNKAELETSINAEIEKLQPLIPGFIFGYDDDLLEKVVGELLSKHKKTISTAESCTGGYLSHLITSIAGSSEYYKGSVIAYSNEVKMNLLQVKATTLEHYGAVSEATVKEMAMGIKNLLQTDYAISISGIAGPDGGSEEKPVGTIWIAVASDKAVIAEKFLLGDDRGRNIRKAALSALNMLRKQILLKCS